MKEELRKALIKEFFFELDTRPTVVKGFFHNRRVGEYIMITVGLPYRERIATKNGRKFVQGR